ncbi:MYCBP-associated protein isoform X3 [Micropterus dolomieu]|uniref:MYCBP-associated protein isoform X3 n=1 Tax=Micropterus dolomieu TaxID=147949 RepID=UPI001E8E9158|nr:MYCBP-associated protein isoform X3 [Micropterus dolomieu]
MSRGESPEKELRTLNHPENKKLKTEEELNISGDDQSTKSTPKGGRIQTRDIHPRDLNNPPKSRQKPVLMACVRKTQPVDGVRNAMQGAVAHAGNLEPDSQPLDYAGLRFDEHGMILAHSILGSLEDFRSYLEAKGETELVKRIPKSHTDTSSETCGRYHSGRGIPSDHRNIQSNALQHWHKHMIQRRQQQGLLSDLLDRPVENLLMNQDNRFREAQEQKEFLNQNMPLIQSGYGYRVGSEFWSLPQHYGDEMSGITATLTKTEQGKREPVTHVAQPRSILQESGITCAETLRPASRTWDQSAYLQHQCQALGEVLRDVDIKKPDIAGLEVIGSGKPVTIVTVCHSPSMEKEKEHKELKKENLDPLAQDEDVRSDALLIPALRFCGQLASWTGNSTTNHGEVGISATIMFEALTGERASSHVELHNEGSTAIFYSWQQLPVPRSFPNLRTQTKSPHFYFNSSSGVILPGDTQRLEFIFKSKEPGIKSELWQLNTHPVLLQGASMQVTLRGVALFQDKTADQRLFIETKLEKIVMLKLCRSIVYEVLQGVHTPERPSSPAELYITEDQEFLSKNPKLQYRQQEVEDLKRLWQEVNPGHNWDFSVDTLRQVVLSLPEQESAQEKSLAQLNSLLLQLSEAPEQKHDRLTAAAVGQQLWRELLDMLAAEAMGLRNLLGLPERDTWIDKKEESTISDADVANYKDEKNDKMGGAAAKEGRSGARSRLTDDNKGESKSEPNEKSVEGSKKKGKRKDVVGKGTKEKKSGKASPTRTCPESISQKPPDAQNAELKVTDIYKRLLHKKVYNLMEGLVDNLCDLIDELKEGDEQDIHSVNT